MENKTHWEQIYTTKTTTQVSWYQEHAELSLEFIQKTGVDKWGQIIDVGGGASTLVDDLLAHGYKQITVLDISAAALQTTQQRLGSLAQQITWLEADITQVELPIHFYDVWHDRAVFHFLTQAADRARYVAQVRQAVRPGGHVIVATFADDGPLQCSGLDVARYNPDSLHAQFGAEFTLLNSTREAHETPLGTTQKFIYCYCRTHQA